MVADGIGLMSENDRDSTETDVHEGRQDPLEEREAVDCHERLWKRRDSGEAGAVAGCKNDDVQCRSGHEDARHSRKRLRVRLPTRDRGVRGPTIDASPPVGRWSLCTDRAAHPTWFAPLRREHEIRKERAHCRANRRDMM